MFDMTWVRLDDNFADHPKVDGLSDGAFRLHVAALCHSGRYLTDGAVTAATARRLTPYYKPKQPAELVGAGLWEETRDGWAIHDYLAYQQSAEKVRADREAASVRMRRHRTPDPSSPECSGEHAPNVRANFDDPIPSHPIPSVTRPRSTPSVASAPSPPAKSESFDTFWQAFPRRNGKRIGRADAERGWARLGRADQEAALHAVAHYRAACDAPSGPLAQDAHRWLAKRRWEDWSTPADVTHQSSPYDRSAWLRRPGTIPLDQAVRNAFGTPVEALTEGEPA